MENLKLWLLILALLLAVALGSLIFNKLQALKSSDELDPSKEYVFSFLCVFEEEILARQLLDLMVNDNLDSSVSLSQNKEKWWAKFQLTAKPQSNEHIRIESKLMKKTEELGGKFGFTDVYDPNAQGTIFE